MLRIYLYVHTGFNTVAIYSYVCELLRFGMKFKCDISLWLVNGVVPCFFYCKFVIFALLTDYPFYKVCFLLTFRTWCSCSAVRHFVLGWCACFLDWSLCSFSSCNLSLMKKLL